MLNHILLIEDDDLLIDNISELLLHNDFQVTKCSDGETAIELIKNNDVFDLIICDILLPKYSGFEVLNFVKNKIQNSQIPFVFLSAKAELSDIREGMNLGADDYLIKPFHIKDLLHLINLRLNMKEIGDHRLYQELKLKLDEFPRILSHELNTPMNGILGLASVMLNNFESFSEKDFKKSLSSIIISCERLMVTQKKLFSFFELLKQTDSLINQKILLEDILITLEFYVKSFNEKEEAKLNRINLSLGDNLKKTNQEVQISSADLIKIIEELLDNSLRHSVKDSKIELNINIIGQKLNISVKNNVNNLKTSDFNLKKNFMDEKKSLNGHQGFGIGLLFIQKICKLHEADFYFLISENIITFYVKFKLI